MPRQLSRRGMCKIMDWLCRLNHNYSKTNSKRFQLWVHKHLVKRASEGQCHGNRCSDLWDWSSTPTCRFFFENQHMCAFIFYIIPQYSKITGCWKFTLKEDTICLSSIVNIMDAKSQGISSHGIDLINLEYSVVHVGRVKWYENDTSTR